MLSNYLKIIIKLMLFYELLKQKSNLLALATQGKQQKPLPCPGKFQIGFDNPANFDLVRTDLQPIEFIDFDKMPNETTLENNSHTIFILLKYNGSAPTIKINFSAQLEVEGTFRLELLYFQWFKEAVDKFTYENITFPGEFHLVFYNVKDKNFYKSINLEKSVVVLAFGVEVNPYANQTFTILEENLKNVKDLYTKYSVPNCNLKDWVKTEMQRFYMYEGSFLPFHCHGKIVWIDFEIPALMSPELVQVFKDLKSFDMKPLMEEVTDFDQPKGKIYTNIPKMPQLGKSPPLTFVYLEEGNNDTSGSEMLVLITIKYVCVLIVFLNLF